MAPLGETGGIPRAEPQPRLVIAAIVAFLSVLNASASMASTVSAEVAMRDLSRLSIEELANIDISSVSKTDQPLSEAAAAIYVITHDDIVRSGASRLPEILRLAPNLQVAQVTATNYAISARGFNGTAAGKLLVLIDGRSVYTPFFSGVFWDVQDVPPEIIERIEVISGPGATLWGANAVNGVINIITRNSAETQGGMLTATVGSRERRASLHYGGAIGETLSYRVYAEAADHDDNVTASGASARDRWRQSQGDSGLIGRQVSIWSRFRATFTTGRNANPAGLIGRFQATTCSPAGRIAWTPARPCRCRPTTTSLSGSRPT